MQRFAPEDPAAYPVYQKALDLGIPILFHAGMSWEPGSRLQYGQPLRFENVAADFPKLRIVLAHLAWPWVTEAVALALKYPNVFLDTSALYFDNPRDFLYYAMTQVVPLSVFERSLRNQLVFGSNYPRVECLERDVLAHLERLAPKEPPEGAYGYWHNRYLDYDGRLGFNAGDHLKSILGGVQCFFPIESGKVIRGSRQRVYFVEYDGPLARTVFVQVIGE